MSTGAWIMLILGSLTLYGGLVYCLILTKVRGKAQNYSELVEQELAESTNNNDSQLGEAKD